MTPYTEHGTDTFLADSTTGVAGQIRVKLLSNGRIAPAAEAEREIGITRIKTKNHLEPCEVRLSNAPGSVEVTLSDTVARGDTVKRQDDGKVGPGGSGSDYGIAGAGGDANEVVPIYPL